jgi:hypothetical protein
MTIDFTDLNQLVVIHTGFYVKTFGGAYDFMPADTSITPYVWRLGQIPPEFRKEEFLMEPPKPKISQYEWTPPALGTGVVVAPKPAPTGVK